MKKLNILPAALALLAALLLAGCGQTKSEPAAMTVNGIDVPQGVLNYYINYGRDYLASYGIDAADRNNGAQYMSLIEEQAVDIVTEIAVVRSLAAEYGLAVKEDALAASLAAEKAYFENDEAWASWLETYEISEADVKWILEYQQLADMLYNEVNSDLELKPEEVEAIYKADPEAYDTYRFAHVLIAPQSTEEDDGWNAARETAVKVLEQIKEGTLRFEDAAAQYNPDSTRATGGDLGEHVTKAESPYVEEFSKAAFALNNINDVTAEPVRTDFGYHLIMLLDKQEGAEAASKAINEEQLGADRYANYEAILNEALEQAEITKEYARQYAAEPADDDVNADNGGQQ